VLLLGHMQDVEKCVTTGKQCSCGSCFRDKPFARQRSRALRPPRDWQPTGCITPAVTAMQRRHHGGICARLVVLYCQWMLVKSTCTLFFLEVEKYCQWMLVKSTCTLLVLTGWAPASQGCCQLVLMQGCFVGYKSCSLHACLVRTMPRSTGHRPCTQH
jgi:hypothetical protein